jgi:ubiquitin C-terminal hydrolase
MAALQLTVKNLQQQAAALPAVSPDCSVRELRCLAQERTGWQVGKVIYKGKVLEDEKTLAASAVCDGAVLICIGATSKRPRAAAPAAAAAAAAAAVPAAAAPAASSAAALVAAAGGRVRNLLSYHPELLELLELLDLSPAVVDRQLTTSQPLATDELPQGDLQRVVAAACGLLLARTIAQPATAALLALLLAAPWELSVLNTVLAMQNPDLPAIPGHALLAGLRWTEATEHQRAQFLNVCRDELQAPARPRLLQRMLLGDAAIAGDASACTMSLARTFLEQGHVNDLIVAVETDDCSAPRFLAQHTVGLPGMQPLLRFFLLGYQHSPALHLATCNVLTAAAAAAAAAADRGQHTAVLELEELQSHMRRLHGNPSREALRGQPAARATSERNAARLALIEESWAATVAAGADKLVRTKECRAGIDGRSSVVEMRPAGLHNLGNTCFANAWLQAMYLTGPFRVALICAPLSTAPKRPSVALALQRLVASLLLSPRRAMDATEFLKAMPKWDCIEGWRSRAQQQDSAEFGQLLLDRVEYEVKDIPGAAGVVSGAFGGVVASIVRCDCCGACSASRENLELFCLSIDLPVPKSDQSAKVEAKPIVTTCQLVAEHFVAEKLEGGEGKPIYRCENASCASGLVPATKALVVVEAPRHMLLSLKRFSFDGSAMKLTQRVGLSLWIWLPVPELKEASTGDTAAPATHEQGFGGGSQSRAEAAAPASSGAASEGALDPGDDSADSDAVQSEQPQTRMYVLYAVVVHSGVSASSGHYYTYGRRVGRTELETHHSPTSPVAALAALLWQHGCAVATMAAADRDGSAGRAQAAQAARKLREGMEEVGGVPPPSSVRERAEGGLPVHHILGRLAAELELLEGYAASSDCGAGRGIAAALHTAGNLLSQYAEAAQGSLEQQWWLYNDATVSPVAKGFDAVENLGASNAHETPYLLLYKRCDPDEDEAEDSMGVDEVPPTVRYQVYNDELALLKRGTDVAPKRREVKLDPKWSPPPAGGGGAAGGGAARMPHRFGPAGGGAMGGGHMPKWGM